MKRILLTLFALAFASSLWAQERTITGKVTTMENGSALPGVNVVIKGTTNGTVTDSEGKYSLSVPNSGGNLIFSFIGLKTVEIPVGDRTVVDVQLGLDVTQLSEIVVTGVGVATDKKQLAISVESVSADKLPVLPAASIDQALVGKIAGAQIMSSSGNPGAPVSIQLRGINTLSGGTGPMIMVDGIQLLGTSLNSLDLSNIERVEVVQGASAATIYGAQGANGVIQVFTKKGKNGKMVIDASLRTSTDQLLNVGNLHQPKMHSFTTNTNGDMLDNVGNVLTVIPPGFWSQVTWENGPGALNNKPYQNNTKYYDHVGQLFNKAKTTNFNLSLSGGKDKSDYAFTFSKLSQESIIQGKLDRYNVTSNFGFEIVKGLKFRSTTQLIYTDNTVNPYASGNNGYLSAALYTWPFADFKAKDSDGNYLYKFGGAGTNSSNPLYAKQFQHFETKTIDIVPSLNLNYTASKILTLDYKLGLNYSISDFNRTTANQTATASYLFNSAYYTTIPTGQFAKNLTNNYFINSLATATAKIDFDKDLKISLPITSTTQVAFDWRRFDFHRTYPMYTGLPVGAKTGDINGAQATSVNVSEYDDTFITYGFLVNQRLEFKDIAGVSGGFRSDYSSVYNDAKTPFTFPRGDGYFRLSKLALWDGISRFFPEFKIRAAYGEAGIQPVSYHTNDENVANNDFAGPAPYHFQRQTVLNTGIADGSYYYTPSVVGNAGLKVERTSEFEYGVDFGFSPIENSSWFNYFNGSVSVWQRKSTGVVWTQTLPVSSGATGKSNNYLDLASQGVQFSLDAQVYSGSNLRWNLTTLFGHSISKVEKTIDGKDIPLTYGNAATYTLKPGERIGSVYGYKALTSFDQKAPDGTFYLDQTQTANYTKVDGRVVEIASRKVQFTSDKYSLGNTTPKFNMSFTNAITYKDFLNVSFQIDWVSGVKTYNQTKEWMYSEGLHGDYDKSVNINGEKGPWTAYYKSFYDASESNGTKDYFLENSSFARLRNVSVGLDFAKLFAIKKFSKLQLVFSGRNLATITKYTGFDPEASENTAGGGTGSGTPQSATQRGLDFWSFPNFKSYQVGLNVSF